MANIEPILSDEWRGKAGAVDSAITEEGISDFWGRVQEAVEFSQLVIGRMCAQMAAAQGTPHGEDRLAGLRRGQDGGRYHSTKAPVSQKVLYDKIARQLEEDHPNKRTPTSGTLRGWGQTAHWMGDVDPRGDLSFGVYLRAAAHNAWTVEEFHEWVDHQALPEKHGPMTNRVSISEVKAERTRRMMRRRELESEPEVEDWVADDPAWKRRKYEQDKSAARKKIREFEQFQRAHHLKTLRKCEDAYRIYVASGSRNDEMVWKAFAQHLTRDQQSEIISKYAIEILDGNA